MVGHNVGSTPRTSNQKDGLPRRFTIVTFADGVLSGTADSLTLNVIGVTGGAVKIAGGGKGIEALIINATTAASKFAVNGDAELGGSNSSVKSVTVTGDADLELTGKAFAKVTTFDASEAKGGVSVVLDTAGGTKNTINVLGGSGKDAIDITNLVTDQYTTITVKTGAGNDKVLVGDKLSAKHTIDGGAGKNTLVIEHATSATHLGLVNNQTSNFQVMEFTKQVDALDAAAFTGFTDYTFTQASDGKAGTAITGLVTGDKLTFKEALTGVAETKVVGETAVGKAALTLSSSSTKQSVTLDLTKAVTGGVGADGAKAAEGKNGLEATSAIVTAGIETLTINASAAITIAGGKGGKGGADAADSGVGGAAAVAIDNGSSLTTVNITGSKDVTIVGGAAGAAGEGEAAGGKAADGFSGAVTVNASALSGKLVITGSADADTITVGSGGSTVNATAGGDTIGLGSGADVVVYAAGTLSGLASSATLTAFNLGIDTIKNLGSNDVLNVKAIGGAEALTTLSASQKTLIEAEFATSGGLKAAMVALEAAIGVNKAAQINLGGDTFLMVTDNAGGLAAGDLIVRIEGEVTLTADNVAFT